MGPRDVRRRLTASTEELHHQSLLGLWQAHGTTPIASVSDRERVRIGGEVQSVQVIPRSGAPSLEVSVHEGTGPAVARFTGPRQLRGTPNAAVEGTGGAGRVHL